MMRTIPHSSQTHHSLVELGVVLLLSVIVDLHDNDRDGAEDGSHNQILLDRAVVQIPQLRLASSSRHLLRGTQLKGKR